MSEARREPLWKRNMPGLRHIRGILFDEKDAYLYEKQMGMQNSSVPQVKTAEETYVLLILDNLSH